MSEVVDSRTHINADPGELRDSSPISWRYHVGVILATLVISTGYLWAFAFLGWLPHDEGLLGHSAERVLQGELPHRDFADAYTGGLSFLHALGFRAFGTSLSSLRMVLLIATLLWIPMCYGIAVRFVSPVGAAVLTLACVAWGPPNYFASMPSWYNLFFATAGTLCLFVFFEKHHLRWLILAGICGGLSITIKIIGLYWIAAALLAIWFHNPKTSVSGENRQRQSIAMLFLTILFVLPVPLILIGLTLRRFGVMEFSHFVFPGTVMSFLVILTEFRRMDGEIIPRLRKLALQLAAFGTGVLLPLFLFSIPYACSGSLGDLWYGVFVLPRLRLNHAALPMLPASSLVSILPVIFMGIAGWLKHHDSTRNRWAWLVAQVGLACALYVSTYLAIGYGGLWCMASNSLPAISILLAFNVILYGDQRGVAASRLFAVVASAAFVALVQFPFAAAIYFCYAAPLLLLALFAVYSNLPRGLQSAHWIGLLLFMALIVFRFSDNPLGFRFGTLSKFGPVVFWDDSRIRLWVGGRDQAQYSRIQSLVQRHVPVGRPIYAVPDCPEVYFVAERSNPTPTMYDFFDDPLDRSSRLIRMLEELQIPLVVIHRAPLFSSHIDREVYRFIRKQYRDHENVGNFIVFWNRPNSENEH